MGQISVVLNIAFYIIQNVCSPVYGPFYPRITTLAAHKHVTERNHVLVRVVEKSLVWQLAVIWNPSRRKARDQQGHLKQQQGGSTPCPYVGSQYLDRHTEAAPPPTAPLHEQHSSLHAALSMHSTALCSITQPKPNGNPAAWEVTVQYVMGMLNARRSTPFTRQFTGCGRCGAQHSLWLWQEALSWPGKPSGSSLLRASPQNTEFTASHKWLTPAAKQLTAFQGKSG